MLSLNVRGCHAVLLVASIALVGCSKHAGPVPENATGEAVPVKRLETGGKEIIPGENAVKEALSQKEYNAAVDRYTTLKQAVATPQQQDEYMSLYGQLRSELEDAARTDQKAAEALAMFRMLRNGR